MSVHEGCILGKGLIFFKCLKCGVDSSNYANGVNICNTCLNESNKCAICGEQLPK